MAGQLIPRTRTVVTCRQWPDGQPAGPSGGLCHVAATETKQKEEGEREYGRGLSSQRRCNGAAEREWRPRVAVGE